MLTLANDNRLFLQGGLVNLSREDVGAFLMANIGSQCDIGGARMSDIMDAMSHLQSFIQDYFLEEYHVLEALVASASIGKVERVEIYKEMVVDGSSYVTMVPKMHIVLSDEGGELKDASVVLVEQLVLNDFSDTIKDLQLNSKFTLLEVMDCLFSELGHTLLSGAGDQATEEE